MQRLEVSGAVRPLYWSLGVKELRREIFAAFNFRNSLYIPLQLRSFFISTLNLCYKREREKFRPFVLLNCTIQSLNLLAPELLFFLILAPPVYKM